MDAYGLSFSPTQSLDKTQKPTDPNANVQEAIRTLALRIPKVNGARGFAPDALMAAPGAQIAPQGGLGLDRLLAALFGNAAPSNQGSAAPPMGGPLAGGASAPAPHIGGLLDPQPDLLPSPEPAPSAPPAPPMPRGYNTKPNWQDKLAD